jgi:uncharacterized protein (TIGR04255 family)
MTVRLTNTIWTFRLRICIKVSNVTAPIALPSFKSPPVHEVAIAVQFRGCDLKSVHLGQFWQSVRVDFPVTEDLAPFANLDQQMTPQVEFVNLPPLRRLRMSKQDGSISIQLQGTRFVTNWVRSNPTIEYPRFPSIFAAFETNLAKLSDFIDKEGVGRMEHTHFELTYVNEIGEVSTGLMRRLESLLGFCKWNHISRSFLPDPSVVNFAWQFDMPNDAGVLVLNVNPAKRSDGTDVIIFALKCLVAAEKTSSSPSVWFEAAHAAIVKSFAELTTLEAHQLWGKIKNESDG